MPAASRSSSALLATLAAAAAAMQSGHAAAATPESLPLVPAGSCAAHAPSTSHVTLSDGRKMPKFGLGVYQAHGGGETEKAVLHALRHGYRHIDTAEIYGNEEDVGRAVGTFLAETGLPREELWVTTKFFPRGGGEEAVRAAIRGSLRKLRMEYVDLYLIHAPLDVEWRAEQWRACEALKEEGLARSIGVSNYGIKHLEELLATAKHKPVVNQIEVNPYITRSELCAWCVAHDILVEAYSPLTKGAKLNDPKLVRMASKYTLTPAQLMIRWCLQKDYIVIPKSVTPSRIEENAALGEVDISAADMGVLEHFDEYLVTGWDPVRRP